LETDLRSLRHGERGSSCGMLESGNTKENRCNRGSSGNGPRRLSRSNFEGRIHSGGKMRKYFDGGQYSVSSWGHEGRRGKKA